MTEPALTDFQKFLNGWMARTGNSQYQLHLASQVGQSMISRWLATDARRTTPTPESLRKLSAVVGVSHADLMRLAGYATDEPAPGADEPLDPELASLMSDLRAGWRNADPTTRRIGQDVVRAAFHVNRPRRARGASEHKSGSDAGLDNPKNDYRKQLSRA